MKEELVDLKAKIIHIHKGDNFEVETETGSKAICKPSGKVRQCKIKLVVGDIVKVELSPYDLSKGRIVYKEKN